MKKELYVKPKAVTAIYFDGSNFDEIKEIAPKAIEIDVAYASKEYEDIWPLQKYFSKIILNGDFTDRYDNVVYPGQWVIAKTYTRSKYHKESEVPEVWYEILDNLDEYIETSKVTITE